MTGRQNNPPEKRHGFEMQFMVQSLGARLPQTQGASPLGVSVNRSNWSDLSRSFGAKAGQPYGVGVDVAE
ncbi:hypothetical protein EHI44_11300 [Rhizobium leguminosarum]|uniref:hypothetical protein n=1 Tax=Rhizobium leguminosarum TaxID=384 RepID=UPI00027D8628|nr:hypothetical protein [Rhizobium leguminosarum]RWY88631.1 hypothetical protein EHI44_11300 [Rhizobium leguminosarum]